MSENEKTLTIEEAGRRYFGLCRASSYRAADRGEIPFIQIGRLKRVPIAAMEKMMTERRDVPEAR